MKNLKKKNGLTYYHIVCSPNKSTRVEAVEATSTLEPQVET